LLYPPVFQNRDFQTKERDFPKTKTKQVGEQSHEPTLSPNLKLPFSCFIIGKFQNLLGVDLPIAAEFKE
jgi:hypothetical protein